MGIRSLTRIALAVACLASAAQAQPVTDLPSAVRRALDGGPEVSARLNALRGAVDAIDVARGATLPQVNLEAEAGRASDRLTNRTPANGSLNRAGVALSLSQLLYDGFAVQGEVDRLGHERLARWFELNDVSEQIALEVTKAWIDVQRMRRMVQLAEDNYVQHRYAYEQIGSRVKAGVARGVDLEQASARLALAESNLTTEKSNLHDVSERFLRLVGERAPQTLAKATGLDRNVPASAGDALRQAASQAPAVSAAVAALRAAKATGQAREAQAWRPRVEARARVGGGHNFDGVESQKRDANVALVLNWNLYSGGSDQARIRQQVNLINQAADLRDKACRDVRQTTAIAYNDVRKLAEQLPLLDRNTLAIEKARDAYRQQFDIGQRSLLDLLNAENEVYTARRAYANAEADQQLAQARTHAAMGRLLATLGLRGPDASLAPGADNWQAGDESAQRCPLEVTQIAAAEVSALDARAQALTGTRPAAAPTATPAPAAVVPAAAKPAAATDDPTPRLRDWAAAWSAKNVEGYLGFYASDFKPAKGSRAAWEQQRRRLVGKDGAVEVTLDDISTRSQPDGSAITSFTQKYRSANFNDTTKKELRWQRQNGGWVIVQESNR